MTIDEIRKIHYERKAKEKEKINISKKLLDILDDETIAEKTGLQIDKVRELRAENN